MFAECEEACGDIMWSTSLESFMRGNVYSHKMVSRLTEDVETYGEFCLGNIPNEISDLKPFREYYGMSTKRAQKITGGDGNKTSEGISRPVEVKYPVNKLLDNVESYLRSCMTYTNSSTLSELKNAEVVILGGSGDSSYRK